MSTRTDYRAAAAALAAADLDGWAIDPEATMVAFEEFTCREDFRQMWRAKRALWLATGDPVAAAWMVECERIGPRIPE